MSVRGVRNPFFGEMSGEGFAKFDDVYTDETGYVGRTCPQTSIEAPTARFQKHNSARGLHLGVFFVGLG